MEPTGNPITDDELTDKIRRAAYIHFGQDDILALEELIRRYKHAKLRSASIK